MAPKVFPYSFQQSAKILPRTFRVISTTIRSIIQPPQVSVEYQRWCDRLIWQRFWLCIGLAAVYTTVAGIAGFYEIFINPARLIADLQRLQVPHLLEPIRQLFLWQKLIVVVLVGSLIALRYSHWGQKHPEIILVSFSWAISFIPYMVCGPIWGLPGYPDIILFLVQATILPVYWRMHVAR